MPNQKRGTVKVPKGRSESIFSSHITIPSPANPKEIDSGVFNPRENVPLPPDWEREYEKWLKSVGWRDK